MGDVIHPAAFGAQVIPLRPDLDAPAFVDRSQPVTPRRTFGLLGTGGIERTLDAALGSARADDASRQENFKRIARELRGATAGAVCPSLLKAKAGHAEGLSQALRALAAECKALGATKQANTFSDAADLVELAGAELEA